MSHGKNGLAEKTFDLGVAVLTLSALGVMAKLLKVDLTKLQIMGVGLNPENASLVPGLLGIAIIFTLLAYHVARTEAAFERTSDRARREADLGAMKLPGMKIMLVLAGPAAFFVYAMPLVAGLLATKLLWIDIISVASTVWSLL
jgi:hypothetical protein